MWVTVDVGLRSQEKRTQNHQSPGNIEFGFSLSLDKVLGTLGPSRFNINLLHYCINEHFA